MKTFKKLTKILGFSILGLFISFVIYANWEEPKLSDKLNIKPINLVVFNLKNELTENDSMLLANSLAVQKGITASTVNRIGKTISVTFHEDETSEKELIGLVEKSNLNAEKVDFSTFDGPQCPVPSEYIDFILDAKKLLSFR